MCWSRKFVSGLLLMAPLFLPIAARGQQQPANDLNEIKREIESLKTGQTEILKELLEIKKSLAARPTPIPDTPSRELIIDTEGAPSRGNENARFTLVEFSDYQCPFCLRFVRDTLPLIERDYIKTGKIKYIYRDFPLESLHPYALLASEAAACAGEQGKYWEMHDRLFANSGSVTAKDLTSHAESLGLNPATFQQCLESSKYSEPIRQGIKEAAGLGVNGTPTFFVGQILPNGSRLKVIRVLRGAPAYPTFKEVLDGILAGGQ